MIALARDFVPAADEVGRLQSGQDEDCKLFQKIAEQGHYAGRVAPSNTRQGIYAAAPNGVLLASLNSREPDEVARMLARALERWKELGHERSTPPAPLGAPQHRWEERYPEDGLVLRVVARDVERETKPNDWRAAAWNQDFAWFTREEARSLVPSGRVGTSAPWPAALALRLARCQLVDFVRGQVIAYSPNEVERVEIASTVQKIDGAEIELALGGRLRLAAHGRWPVNAFGDEKEPQEQTRGFEGELLGRATFDRVQGRFTRFELVAVGPRWGGYKFNGRGDDLDPAPMGFSLSLAGATPAEHVPPARIADYGWPKP